MASVTQIALLCQLNYTNKQTNLLLVDLLEIGLAGRLPDHLVDRLVQLLSVFFTWVTRLCNISVHGENSFIIVIIS